MEHFTAHAIRSGRWWAITIDEDPRAQTQARRLDQVEVPGPQLRATQGAGSSRALCPCLTMPKCSLQKQRRPRGNVDD